MSRTVINRPWMSSFEFDRVPYSERHLDQFHKLARNYIASLDLGCPSVRHVKSYKTDRAAYLAWVSDWKTVYRELSKIIRTFKKYRKTIHFPKLDERELKLWQVVNREVNMTPAEHLRGLSERHLVRLQETAMVMLNARYNAKLASAERRRRSLELRGPCQHNGNASVSKTDDVGSSPTLAAEQKVLAT